MAINPLQAPINYAVDVQSPFEAALSGLKLGAGLAEIDAAQQKRQLEVNAAQQAQQRQTDLANLYKNPNATSADYARVAAFLPKDQAAIVTQGFERLTKEQQQSDLRMGGEVYSAIKSGNLDVAKRRLTEKATALRNSGRENEAKAAEDSLELINLNPTGAQATIGLYMARLPGGKDFLDNADKALSTLRLEQLQPSALATAEATAAQAKTKAQEAVADLRIKLQNEPNEAKKLALEVEIKEAEAEIARPKAAAVLAKAVADSTKAAADAQKAFDEAEGTPLRLVREQELLAAQAKEAEIKARFAEKVVLADLKNKAANLGLTEAQTGSALAQTRKLGVETKKAVLELKALESGVGDPKEKFAQEEKIRKEYQGRTKVYGELQGTYNNIKASADTGNGPGDIALITSFMKMLDPGSVVRETEFATARDTAGLFTQLENRLQKAKNGALLNDAQRKEYVELSQKYLDSAQKKAAQERKDLGIVIKNYKLNPENVFGAEQAPPPPLPESATIGGKTYPRPATFTDTQWRDYLKANGVIR